MIVMVSASTAPTRLRSLDPDLRSRLATRDTPLDNQAVVPQKDAEISKLRTQLTTLQNALATETEKSNAAKVLNATLQDTKFYAGLTEVQGPGVLVTLTDGYSADKDDSKLNSQAGDAGAPPATEDVIHDQDILRVVNELYAAGAEAVSINNLRLVGTSSVRCVGPTVLIDGVRIASPIKIRAVGDTDTLMGGLRMPGGIIDELRSVSPRMVTIEPVKNMTLPGYAGPTTRHYVKLVKAEK
jgi:uncharacterized protein YlxW (UPF0749 family)